MTAFLLLGYSLIGLFEWFLAAQRTWEISQGRSGRATVVTLFENLFGFFVLFQFLAHPNSWPLAVAYSLGAALGTLINMRLPF